MSKTELNEKIALTESMIRDHKTHIAEITRARKATAAYLDKYSFEYQPSELPLTALLESHQKGLEECRATLGKLRRGAKLLDQMEALEIA